MHIKESSLLIMLMMSWPAQAAITDHMPDFCNVAASYHETAAIYKEKGLSQSEALSAIQASVRRAVQAPESLTVIEGMVQVATDRVYGHSWYAPKEHARLGRRQCESAPDDYLIGLK